MTSGPRYGKLIREACHAGERGIVITNVTLAEEARKRRNARHNARRAKIDAPNAAGKLKIKEQLAARDGRGCFWCGRVVALSEMTLDHLVPHAHAHTWHPSALVLACGPCNTRRGDQLPQQIVRPGLVRRFTWRLKLALAA